MRVLVRERHLTSVFARVTFRVLGAGYGLLRGPLRRGCQDKGPADTGPGLGGQEEAGAAGQRVGPSWHALTPRGRTARCPARSTAPQLCSLSSLGRRNCQGLLDPGSCPPLVFSDSRPRRRERPNPAPGTGWGGLWAPPPPGMCSFPDGERFMPSDCTMLLSDQRLCAHFQE